jgi:FHA domain-containing protein
MVHTSNVLSEPSEVTSPTSSSATVQDRAPAQIWLGGKPVLQLRQWGTEASYPLPPQELAEVVIGSHPSDVDLRLLDVTGSISRRHARMVRSSDAEWTIRDLNSRNGIRIDGVRMTSSSAITPGTEIGIGGVTLIAENTPLLSLRAYLARLLGWGTGALADIDQAVRAIRWAAYRRIPLTIAGREDLVGVARQLHTRCMPPRAPFVVCGRRYKSEARIEATKTTDNVFDAFELAEGGTICVRASDLPDDYDELYDMVHDSPSSQLYIVSKRASRGRPDRVQPIAVADLSRRPAQDRARVVHEYALDALRELGGDAGAFTADEHEWVLRNECGSFGDIEDATLRIVAHNVAGTVYQAATRLGVSHQALGRWFDRRRSLVRLLAGRAR